MKVGMIAPRRAKCGVSDYTDYLVAELGKLVDLEYVADSMDFRPEMNAVDLIHVQHQYFLYGGVAPWKNKFDQYLRQLTAPVVLTAHEFVAPVGIRGPLIRLTNSRQFDRPIRKIV